jgi:hypothetical protein
MACLERCGRSPPRSHCFWPCGRCSRLTEAPDEASHGDLNLPLAEDMQYPDYDDRRLGTAALAANLSTPPVRSM